MAQNRKAQHHNLYPVILYKRIIHFVIIIYSPNTHLNHLLSKCTKYQKTPTGTIKHHKVEHPTIRSTQLRSGQPNPIQLGPVPLTRTTDRVR